MKFEMDDADHILFISILFFAIGTITLALNEFSQTFINFIIQTTYDNPIMAFRFSFGVMCFFLSMFFLVIYECEE